MRIQNQMPGRVSLVIYAYGDDGSDAKQKRVTAVSIVAGFEQSWQEVEDQWTVRCAGIPFHATDCETDPPRGDYANKVSFAEAKEMYRDLTGIVASSDLGGVGVGIDLAAQERIFPHSLPLAYHRAFVECIERAAGVAERLGEVCEITYDIAPQNEANAASLYSWLRESNENLCRSLHPRISFASWRDSARLQVADLLAYEAWKALDHAVGPVKRNRRSWELLRATGRFETYSYSQEWFVDLKAHIDSGDVARLAGFKDTDYKDWLTKRKRSHNIGSMFEFLRSL